jgi:serine phosphatase RsbU (regulator of sigma subunit)
MNEHKELYGFERFTAAIAAGRTLAPTDLVDSLLDDVSRYVGDTEQHDDLTLVVVQVQ